MGSPFFFPEFDSNWGGGFDQGYQAPRRNNDYLSLYQNNARNFAPIQTESFLDPLDPDVVKLRNLYGSPTGSEDIVNSYIGARPEREDYSPGLGRKLAAFLLGTFSGPNAYNAAQSHIERPYLNAYKDWEKEGSFIDDRVRLNEAERAREIKATEFGLRAKNDAARRKEQEGRSFRSFLGNVTGQGVRDENADLDRELRRKRNEELGRLAEERLGLSRERYDLSRERYENPNYKPVDLTDPSTTLQDQEAAKKLVEDRVLNMREFKPFKDYVDRGGTNLIEFVDQNPTLAGLLNNFRAYMRSEVEKMMSNRGRITTPMINPRGRR